ncbi:MAG: hypothetical protein AB8B83_07735 [Bdellovibrionales bacterium]
MLSVNFGAQNGPQRAANTITIPARRGGEERTVVVERKKPATRVARRPSEGVALAM